jgi:amino acid transporter
LRSKKYWSHSNVKITKALLVSFYNSNSNFICCNDFSSYYYCKLFGADEIIRIPVTLSKRVLLFSSLFAALGFIYCTLGYHVKIERGDELKFKIHLESLHVTFTSTLVSLFVLIFIFINFSPMMLNWILVILTIIAIITYLIASLLIQDKYQ